MNTQTRKQVATPKAPNVYLPYGAQLITPREVYCGTWRPQIVDAEVTLEGIKWYRVQGGFGDLDGKRRNEREDWIADIESISVSVHDYHWNGLDFGSDYGTFENACRQELALALRHALESEQQKTRELEKLRQGIDTLKTWRIEHTHKITS